MTEFTALRAGRTNALFFQPRQRSLKTKQSAIFLMQEIGSRKVSIDEARGMIRGATPVAVAYRHDDQPPGHQLHKLWKEMGSRPTRRRSRLADALATLASRNFGLRSVVTRKRPAALTGLTVGHARKTGDS